MFYIPANSLDPGHSVASGGTPGKLFVFLAEHYRQSETHQLFNQDVERFRSTRLRQVLALDNRLVNLAAPHHVIALDRQHFLQGVRGAVGLQGPDLHLAETLAAELRLTGERL